MKIKKNNIRYFLLNNSFRFRNNKNFLDQSFFSSNDIHNNSKDKNNFNTNKNDNLNNKNIKYKSIPLLYLSNLENKINDKVHYEYNPNNNLSTKSSSSLYKLTTFNDISKNKLDSNSSYNSTINDRTHHMIKSIIKNFEQNKLSTQILLNKEKKMELNSLNNVTEKNVEFLLSEGDCSCEENSINNENNSYRLCSKLVKLFNEKTNDILNTSQNNLQTFSKIKYQFSKDLINNFQNIRFSENNLKKLRNKYIEANEIMEQINEDKIKRAKQLEKKFYEIKNEENYSKSEIKYRELLDLENLESKKRKYILSFLRNRINQELRQTLNIKKINPNIKYNNLYKKEEKLKNAQKLYK